LDCTSNSREQVAQSPKKPLQVEFESRNHQKSGVDSCLDFLAAAAI
jgi:hypothetical protein